MRPTRFNAVKCDSIETKTLEAEEIKLDLSDLDFIDEITDSTVDKTTVNKLIKGYNGLLELLGKPPEE